MTSTMDLVACGKEELSMMIRFGSFLDTLATSCRGKVSPSRGTGRLSRTVDDLREKEAMGGNRRTGLESSRT